MANFVLPFAIEIPLKIGCVGLSVFIGEEPFQTGETCLSTPHNHNDFELFYFTKGNGVLTVKEEPVSYQAGEMLLIAPGEYHYQEKSLIAEGTERFGLFFSLHPLSKRATEEEKRGYTAMHNFFRSFRILTDENGILLPTLNRIAEEMKTRKEGYFSCVSALSVILITQILRLSGTSLSAVFPSEEPRNSGYYRNQIERFLRHHYTEKVGLPDLARALSVSERQAARLMRSSFGVSFIEKLTELRVLQAKHLLRGGAQGEDVASACGFGSYSYFATCFRQKTGMSPQAYRKKCKE